MSVLSVLEGGMGSQMFGYAYGRALSLIHETDLFIDIRHLHNHRIPRDYSLGVFNIQAEMFSPKVRIENPIKISGYSWMGQDCFAGYESVLRSDFTFNEKAEEELRSKSGYKLFQEVEQCESVSIGVRRGDFANDPTSKIVHGTIPLGYYHEAINHIAAKVDNPVFYLFSDDMKWVKKYLQPNYPHVYVCENGLNFQEEFLLNSRCKHHIISNSTFFWWSAWLGAYQDKMVYAPGYWHHKYKPRSDFFPKEWVVL